MSEEKKPTFAGAGVMGECEGIHVTANHPGPRTTGPVTVFSQGELGYTVPPCIQDLDDAERILKEGLKTIAYLKKLLSSSA